MNTNDIDIPEEINVHKQNWGKNADQVIYGREGRESGEIEMMMNIDVFFADQELMNMDIVHAGAIWALTN